MAITTERKSGFMMGTNPMIRKLSRVQETDSTNSCSYAGITVKLIYFMVMVMAGVVLNALMAGKWGGEVIKFDNPAIVMTMNEMIAVVVAALLLVITPLISLIRVTIPVSGALFCASTGFIISWAGSTFGKEYAQTIWLALIITAFVVVTMGFLYFSGRVRVTGKFKTILISLLVSTILASILMFVGSLIPATRGIVRQIAGNAVINIGASVIMVIIATLFLLVDFDTIRRSVDDGLPKKYEWTAAFGLAFSVIWLFFKILELLGKLKGDNKN